MALSKKEQKYIRDKYPRRSVKQLARELGVKPAEVRSVLESSGGKKKAAAKDQPAEKKPKEKKAKEKKAGESKQASQEKPPVLGFARAHPLGIMLIIAVISVVYLNSMRNGFHYDDIHSLKKNLKIQVEWTQNPESRKLFLEYFYKPEHFSSRPQVAMPRPLLLSTFALNYMWTEFNAWSWILVNILFHLGCTLLIYLGLCHLAGRPRMALLTALIFAIHPVNTETVNYINCRSESMSVFFMLLVIYFWARSLREDRTGLLILSFVFFATGLLTKELVFVTPAILAAIDIIFVYPAKDRRKRWTLDRSLVYRLRYYLPLVGIWIAYFIYRKMVLDTMIIDRKVRPIIDNLVTQSRVLLTYLRLHIYPVKQNISYENIVYETKDLKEVFTMLYVKLKSLSLSSAESVELWSELVESDKTLGQVLMVFLAMAVIVVLAFLAIYWIRKHPVISFCIANFFITLSITSVVPLNAIMNEHRLYLPSLSFCILLAGFLDWMANYLNSKRGKKQSAVWPVPVQVISIVLILLYVSLTVNRNFSWHTDLTVWQNSIWNSPTKAQVVSDLGNAYFRTGRDLSEKGSFLRDGKIDKEERITINQTFLEDVPEGKISAETRERLEELYLKGLDRAEKLYQWGVRVESNYYKAWHNLGTINYSYAHYYIDKAREYQSQGDQEKMMEYIKKARKYFLRASDIFLASTRIYPNGESYNDLGSTLKQSLTTEKDPAIKKQVLHQVEKLYFLGVEWNPELYKGYTNIGRIMSTLGRTQEAIPFYERSFQIEPRDYRPPQMLGQAYLKLNKPKQAVTWYNRCLNVHPQNSNCRKGREKAQQKLAE
ncbi:MAG: glycosyltransferase family 39 protein [bacterium]